jgi:hypothetical protein
MHLPISTAVQAISRAITRLQNGAPRQHDMRCRH